jgi:integrase
MNTEVENFLASFPLSDSTKDKYRRVLVHLPPCEHWTAADLLKFISKPNWGNSQRYTALCACRKFISFTFGVNHPALRAKLKRVDAKPQRVLSKDLALKLLASFDTSTAAGSRDLAIASLALDTGLRCSELCRLTVDNVDLIERHLQVIVKGGQWKAAIFSEQTAMYISAWLHYRKPINSSALFLSFHHKRTGRALTREGLQGIVKRWGIGLDIKLSPHDFRRSFATLSTIFGAPSRVVQVAGRWSSLDMVTHYTESIQAEEIIPYLPVSNLSKI